MRVLLFSEKDTGLREAEPAEDAKPTWTKAVSQSCPSSQASLLQSQPESQPGPSSGTAEMTPLNSVPKCLSQAFVKPGVSGVPDCR